MRVVLIMALFLLFSGCKSKYELTTENRERSGRIEQTNTIESEQVQQDTTGSRVKEVERVRQEDQETETEVKVTEYDTSKPIVESTGKPPVLRETVTKKREKQKGRENVSEKETELTAATTRSDRTTEIQQVIQDTKELDSNSHESRKRKSGGVWFGIGFGIILLGGFILLIRRI